MNDVLIRMTKALKQYGILYASFKYGTEEYEKVGRYFSCYEENSFTQLVNNLNDLQFLKMWVRVRTYSYALICPLNLIAGFKIEGSSSLLSNKIIVVLS